MPSQPPKTKDFVHMLINGRVFCNLGPFSTANVSEKSMVDINANVPTVTKQHRSPWQHSTGSSYQSTTQDKATRAGKIFALAAIL